MGVRKRPVAIVMAAALLAGTVPTVVAQEAANAGGDDEAAIDFLQENFADYGLEAGDVANLAVTSSYTSKHSGVTHVNLNQRYQGLEVFTGHGTVNLAKDGTVVFVGQDFVADLDAVASSDVAVGAAAAMESAASALDLEVTEEVAVISREAGLARETILTDGGVSEGPVGARLGWQPTSNGLRKAWQLTIDAADEEHMWNATVDAETGQLLAAEDWVVHDRLEDLESTLSRGSRGRSANVPGTQFPTPNIPVNDGSSYRVYAVPLESPNDGPRVLLTNPADGGASPFGWHDTNGVPGAEFQTTRGNNNHAYLDQDDNEQADFGADVSGGAGLDFDFPADLNEHAQAYREAVTTNLFYGCNAIHDILWNYGFNEASGNFQANNYGRGGVDTGDYVRCEAADGSGTNNANFGTPTEPPPNPNSVPRMQMYLWPGSTTTFGMQNEVFVNGVGYGAAWARFGPPALVAGLTGTLVNAGNGCLAGDYPAVPPAGNWIAVVDGGTAACQYLVRTTLAQAAGADAVIVAHNTAAAAPVMGGAFTAAPVQIPTVSVTQADGALIKAAAGSSATVRKTPNRPAIRDGDFENGIIFHEFGHGVSNRLTGGPAVNCLSGNEQAGEGWSDYLGTTLLLDPAIDDPDEPRGMGPYALFQEDRHGAGIRPRPYTRDMVTQPFTYDSIKTQGWLSNTAGTAGTSLALPHGLGHGWNSVLWDMTWDLIDKHGFNPNVYADWDTGGNNRSLQYVMDGMKLQGCGPGLVVAARAIIASAQVLGGGTPGVDAQGRTLFVDGEDTCTVWDAFARRGLGYSAVQGTTNRDDNTEAFDTHPDCRRDFLPPPTLQPYGGLTDVIAGDVRVLRFTADGYKNLDVLTPTAPYSRQVYCEGANALKPTRNNELFQTPKAAPELAATPGNSGLAVSKTGMFTFPWETSEAWLGQCRELVLQRDDGVQHRAFFRFVEG
jgi:extracellular elastinolytic metalloproteinase